MTRLSTMLLRSAIDGDKEFAESLRRIVHENLGMEIAEFAIRAGISPSTLYKAVSEGRSPNLRTLRSIVNCIDEIEGSTKGEFIAVIAARFVLDRIEERTIDIDGGKVNVREYPATNIEEVILAAIRSEEDGARAIVCAPIVVSTVERFVHLPIVTISPKSSVIEAIKTAAKKASM